jgi:acetyl esterase/lipase
VFGPGKVSLGAQPLFVLREHTLKPTQHGYELTAAPEGSSESTWLISVVGVGKQDCSLVKPGPGPEIKVGADDIAWNDSGDVTLNGTPITGNLMPQGAASAAAPGDAASLGLAGDPPPAPPDAPSNYEELITNPGFDSGLEDWQPQKLQGTAATFEVKDIENAKHALCVTVPQAAEKRYYVQLLHGIYTQLYAGKSYSISFRAKAAPDASIVVVLSSSQTPPGEMLRQDDIALTSDWKDYSYTFTPASDSTATHLTISGLAAQAGEYWFTNVSLHEVAGTGTSTPPPAPPAPAVEKTPATLPGAQTFIYRDGTPEPMRLHVFKPAGWTASDHRPALVFYFGGGWTTGTPSSSAIFSRRAAALGWVGISPDYRTKGRCGTSPLESVADSRAALRWVQDHAAELGIDPAKIVVGGHSAGGHVALWTAIDHTPPGSDPNEAPHAKPAALFLLAPVSDTSRPGGYTPFRFGANDVALSPINQLDGKMPPTLLMHADTDEVVPYRESVALSAALIKNGAVCDFVTVPGGKHGFPWQHNGYDVNTIMDRLADFLKKNGVLTEADAANPTAAATP